MSDTPPDGKDPESEPEVDPEQVGADLLRRLDLLDDRLRRSQEQMLSLIDRKLNDHQTPSSPDGSTPESPESRWAPPPPAPSPQAEETQPVADQKSMDAWFGGPLAARAPQDGASTTSPSRSGSGEEVQRLNWGVPTASNVHDSPAPPAGTGVSIVVPERRPAWQSNALAVLITGLVIVVGLFLVGLF